MKYQVGKPGKIVVARFEDRDDVIENLSYIAKKESIRAGVFYLVGGMREGSIVVGPEKDDFPPTPVWRRLGESHEVIGFGITMLSLTKALIKAKGKLLPFGFIHVLKALKLKNDTADMFLQAVRPDYQNKGITAIIYSETMQAYIDNGIKTAITGVQLEDNLSAQLLFDSYENRMHLKRRCFIKLI